MAQALKFFISLLLVMMCHEITMVRGFGPANVCHQPYGCFSSNPPWNDFVFYLLPQSPTEINTSFKLYNAAKPNGVSLDQKSNALSREDKLVILIHGIDSHGGHDNSMYTALRPELLKRKTINVVTVDWSGGVSDTNLFRSIGNSRLVSAQLAYLIKRLTQRRKLRCKNIHIIGFSLGASMAGLVGKQVKKEASCNIARITGLDPIKNSFEDTFDRLPTETKLERSDAKFVDVIHTHTAYKKRVGNVDYYPNGGLKQPGCPERDTILIGATAACNHFRAVELFKNTIVAKAKCCVAIKCESYDKFEKGRCSANSKRKMGFETNTAKSGPKGNFYLKTGGTSPYCEGNCPTSGS